MKIVYAKNPAELTLMDNPSKKTTKRGTNMAKRRKRRKKDVKTTAKQLIMPAVAVVAGQVVATQVTRQLLQSDIGKNPQTRKLIAVGAPIAAGVVAATYAKDKMVKQMGVGMAVAGVTAGLYAVSQKLAPTPLAGLDGMLADSPALLADDGGFDLPMLPEPEETFIADYEQEEEYFVA